jgi:hypothetical protein
MPVEGIDLDSLVFLVGVPRSGTSLLYKLLCLHPEVAYISNWLQLAPGLLFLALLNRLAPAFPGIRRNVWFGPDRANAYVHSGHRTRRERLFPMPIEGSRLYRRHGIDYLGPEGRPDRARLSQLREALAAVRRYSGGRVLVTKYLGNNHHIPELVEQFPTARFVNIVRDGRAVAFSLSQVHWWQDTLIWWYGGTPDRWQAEGRDPWELCARHWVQDLAVIDDGLAAVPASQRLQVRYEELVAQPIATVHRIAAFAGLRQDAGWSRELSWLYYPDKNDSWRARLSPSARQRVETIQQGELRRLGYLA